MKLTTVLGVGILIITLFHWEDDFFTMKWAMTYFLLGLAYLYWVYQRYEWVVLPFAASLLFHTLYISVYPFNHYSQGNAVDLLAFEKLSMISLFTLISITLFYSLQKRVFLSKLRYYFIASAVLNSVLIIIQSYLGKFKTGTLGNPSMTASYLALIAPLCGRWGALFIIPIFYCQSSVGFLAFFVATISYLFLHHRNYIKYLVLLTIPAYFIKDFSSDSGRYSIWRLGLKYWWSDANHWIGLGPGTTRVFLPHTQVKYGYMPHLKEIWIWFHNDFLQVLFEQGVIGLCATLVIVVFAIKKSYQKKRDLFPTVMAFLVVAYFNYPSQLPLQALFLAWVLALLFRRDPVK